MESKRQKTQHNEESDSSSKETKESFVSLESILSLEVWKDLPFVGPICFRFLGAVNKQFRSIYLEMYSSKTTFDQIVTVEQAKLFHQDVQEQIEHQLLSCRIMACLGRQEVLEYFHSQDFSWDEETCLAAAQGGHLTLLQWLRQQGCPWVDDDMCDAAAENGNIPMLQWLHEQGCVFSTSTCSCAAENGHLNVLQWLRIEKNCPWDEETCAEAATNGYLHVIQWAHSKGCPWDFQTLHNSIENGHMDVFVFALDHDCPTDDENLSYYAAEYGQLEILQYLHARGGFVLNKSVMSAAARGNHFEIVEWLYSVNCPWDASSCSGAAEKGNLEMLQWLRARDCPWNEGVHFYARRNRHANILQWAFENRCPRLPSIRGV